MFSKKRQPKNNEILPVGCPLVADADDDDDCVDCFGHVVLCASILSRCRLATNGWYWWVFWWSPTPLSTTIMQDEKKSESNPFCFWWCTSVWILSYIRLLTKMRVEHACFESIG